MIRWLFGLAVLLFTVTGIAEAQSAKAPRKDRNRITAEEILEKPTAQSAYDLIKALRPQWLNSRGATTIMGQELGIQVYRSGSKMGSLDELHNIPRDEVGELRFYSPGDATMKFGTDHPSGAIEVETRRG